MVAKKRKIKKSGNKSTALKKQSSALNLKVNHQIAKPHSDLQVGVPVIQRASSLTMGVLVNLLLFMAANNRTGTLLSLADTPADRTCQKAHQGTP
ncbi:MAG: hypothetical protein E7107_07505 [Prevotella sp.]|nr:hypothetical protein [Prevotella sp.]